MTSDAMPYRPLAGGYDEYVDADGSVRPGWASAIRGLGPLEPGRLAERRRQADRLLDAEGTGHLVHDLSLGADRHGHSFAARSVSHPWRLDPLPWVLDAAEFAVLRDGAIARFHALEAFLDDLHGARRTIAEGVLAPSALHATAAYRPVAGGAHPRVRLVHAAVDLVRDHSGRWHVVHDVTDTPSGLGYALLNRSVMARLTVDAIRQAGIAAVQEHADQLRRALTAAAPEGHTNPRAVVLTAGPGDPTYVEHSYLARRMGLHLVEGGDVVMREGRLWLRVLDGLEPIDVVYRRIDDAHLDPLEPGHLGGGAGVPGLVWGARRHGVTVANAYGTGLGETDIVRDALADATSLLHGSSLSLPLLPHGARLATAPVFDPATGGLVPRAVVLRLHLARVGDDVVVMRGGAGRVLADGDTPDAPTAQLTKDVWVVGAGAPTRPVAVTAAPQVDFGTSVPTRVADSLYWLGRAAERAEVAARTARTVAVQLQQDPLVVSSADGAWAYGAAALLRSAQGVPSAPPPGIAPVDLLTEELAATARAVQAQLASLVQEATSVREYLSATTGNVLQRISSLQAGLTTSTHLRVDDLDTLLVDLAALSGLAMESTVRGPSWRFLDLGRRLERALTVLGSVEASLGPATSPIALQSLAESALAANESLVAFRRRYRSDVELDAVLDLLLRDDGNPRSLAYQLDRLREHMAGLAWAGGAALVQQASVAAFTPIDDAVVNGRRVSIDGFVVAVRGPLLELAQEIVRRWFADPVNPTVVRGVR